MLLCSRLNEALPQTVDHVVVSVGPTARQPVSGSAGAHRWKEREMKPNHEHEKGIIKYGIAWMLGVPASLLIVIFLLSRGC
jgi:hypothetical protein